MSNIIEGQKRMMNPVFKVSLKPILAVNGEETIVFAKTSGQGTHVSKSAEDTGLLVDINFRGDPPEEVILGIRGTKHLIPLEKGGGRIEFPPDKWLVVEQLSD